MLFFITVKPVVLEKVIQAEICAGSVTSNAGPKITTKILKFNQLVFASEAKVY